MKILFLYTELADYTIACLSALKKSGSDINVMVIHYPVNSEAPFKFNFGSIGNFKSIKNFKSCKELIKEVDSFNPDKIIVSGWINKWYLKVCRRNNWNAITVLTMDNHYQGTLKQKIFCIAFPIYLKKYFKYCWVPGPPQELYALKLGFKRNQIFQGFYCCNFEKFNFHFLEMQKHKSENFPKRFLCVARYVHQKNYQRLWKAFIKWQEVSPNEWELWCAGTGVQFDQRVIHPKIKHLGFVQAEQWENIINETGVFVLASLEEPWGVAVQEFSAAGFPLLLSNRIGSGTIFLKDNGVEFTPEIESQMIEGFEYFNGLKQQDLIRLSQNSNKFSQWITPSKWAKIIINDFV